MYNVDMGEWQPLGKHLTKVEENLVITVWKGEVELAEVKTLFALYAEVHARHGSIFIMLH